MAQVRDVILEVLAQGRVDDLMSPEGKTKLKASLVQALREQVKRADDNCVVGNSTSNLERWAEKVRLAKVSARTRIAVSGREALVYDGAKPERALYVSGQWLLAEAPELTSPPQPAAKR